jgi:hypothetical protein
LRFSRRTHGGDQAIQMFYVRQNRSHETNFSFVNDGDGGKVFNIFVTEKFWVILDVNPYKTGVGMSRGQALKLGLVFFAGVAPCRTKTYHQRDIAAGESLGERRGVRKKASHIGTRQNDCL